MSYIIKSEASWSGAAAPVIAEVPAPILPGVRGGGADIACAIAPTVTGCVTPLGNMISRESTTQMDDAEPRVGETALVPYATPNPIGQSAQPGLSIVSGNLAEDDHDTGDRRPGDCSDDRAVSELMASLPWASSVSESDSPLDAVLSAFGHDRRCRRRVRAGLAVTCECSTRPRVDDPAIVIGLALRFARTGLSRRLPLPHGIVEQLAHHVSEGDPAAIMVWDWLVRRGLVAARPVPQRTPTRPALRLVCTTEEQ